MKWTNYLFITFLFFIYTCKSETETSGQKLTFGIHEVVQTNGIPGTILDEMKSINVRIIDNPAEFVIGYITKEDSAVLQLDLSDQNFRIVRTIYSVDKEQKYYAIAAVRTAPALDNSHIKKARPNGTNIEIYFNLEGATRWANLTKANIGSAIAFVIDNRVYSMPLVNAEIKSGIAIISGMNDETTARRIAKELVTSDE